MPSRSTSLAAVVVFAATLALGACAGLASGPNSRTMTIGTLGQGVQAGMSAQEVLARIGRPTYVFPLPRQGQDVWNYRFAPPEGDCTVFQVSISRTSGLVAETGQGYDRACDGPNRD
jgi:outer membrane protein assembly factor BamE (lipoprotein component of BamABCDE complex)